MGKVHDMTPQGQESERGRDVDDDPAVGQRVCLDCGAREKIRTNERIWPLAWHCPDCGRGLRQSAGIPIFAPELADTISGFDPASFAPLTEIEETHFWFAARNELIVGLADRFFPHARRYLEIGCGNGAVLRALAASRRWDHMVGADLHPTALANARARLPDGVEFAQLNGGIIPAVGVFDLTGAFDVMEHVFDDEGLLSGLRNATRTGGGAIIAVPQHPSLWSRADEVAHHQRRYRRGEVERKLRHNGFEILFSTSFVALLLPLMAASRLKGRAMQNGADIESEFKLGPRLNAVLTTILRAEVRLTLAGVRWPAGGSRVVAARAV
jgi:SAM-dependent methyltransferase